MSSPAASPAPKFGAGIVRSAGPLVLAQGAASLALAAAAAVLWATASEAHRADPRAYALWLVHAHPGAAAAGALFVWLALAGLGALAVYAASWRAEEALRAPPGVRSAAWASASGTAQGLLGAAAWTAVAHLAAVMLGDPFMGVCAAGVFACMVAAALLAHGPYLLLRAAQGGFRRRA